MYAWGTSDYRKNAGIIRKQSKMSRVQAISAFSLRAKWFQESFSGQEDAFLCFGIISLLLPVSLMAQKDAASLEDRVVDARGAVVAQASVTATNVDATFTYRAEVTPAGSGRSAQCISARIVFRFTAKGFKSSIEGPLTLDVQRRQRVDVTLEPGAVTENVDVHGTPPLIQTAKLHY